MEAFDFDPGFLAEVCNGKINYANSTIANTCPLVNPDACPFNKKCAEINYTDWCDALLKKVNME